MSVYCLICKQAMTVRVMISIWLQTWASHISLLVRVTTSLWIAKSLATSLMLEASEMRRSSEMLQVAEVHLDSWIFITLNLIWDSQRELRFSYQKFEVTTLGAHVHLSRCRVELRVVGDEDGHHDNKLTATTFGNNLTLQASPHLSLSRRRYFATWRSSTEHHWNLLFVNLFSTLLLSTSWTPKLCQNLVLAVSISQVHLQVASSTFGNNLTLQASHLLLSRSFTKLQETWNSPSLPRLLLVENFINLWGRTSFVNA